MKLTFRHYNQIPLFRRSEIARQFQGCPSAHVEPLEARFTKNIGNQYLQRTHLCPARHLATRTGIDLPGLNLLLSVIGSGVPIALNGILQSSVNIQARSPSPVG